MIRGQLDVSTRGQSNVTGQVLLLGVAVALASIVFLGVSGLTPEDPVGDAAVDIEQTESGDIEVTAVTIGGDSVSIEPVGSDTAEPKTIDTSGETVTFSPDELGDSGELVIVSEENNRQQLSRTEQIEGVGSDGGDGGAGGGAGVWNETTYVTSEQRVLKFDGDGNVVWEYYHPEMPDGQPYDADECYDNFYGCMFVDGDYDDGGFYTAAQEPGELFKIDAETGNQEWVQDYGSFTTIVSVTATQDYVVAGHGTSGDGTITVVDKDTGTWEMTHALGTEDGNDAHFVEGLTTAPDGDVIAVTRDMTYDYTHVTKIDPDDGTVDWYYQDDADGSFGMESKISDDGQTVYAAGSESVYALNVSDGTEKWSTSGLNTNIDRFATTSDYVYAVSTDGPAYKLDKESGTLEGTTNTGGWGALACAAGDADSGEIMVGFNEQLERFDSDGNSTWTFDDYYTANGGEDFSSCSLE